MAYLKTAGRVTVEVNDQGIRMQDFGHGCVVSCLDGWNDSRPRISLTMSVEELRDLRYLLDRAITLADEQGAKLRATG